MVSLKDRKWKEFYISQVFPDVSNSKAYHKEDLDVSYSNKGIAYVTRTNKNNGLYDIVEKPEIENLPNSKNTLSLGAENATFFFQPYNYITGNNMYVLKTQNINKQIGLFLQLTLNESLRGCGFGFSTGLTGTRAKNRQFLLPINEEGDPDWNFMENYIKQIEDKQKENYKDFAIKKLKNLEYKEIPPLKEKQWKAFYFKNIFKIMERGKRLKKDDHISGDTPYISSTFENNGIDGFIGNKNCKRFWNCLTIANSGSVGSTFFHKYEFIASDHVTSLKNNDFNEYVYLFIIPTINRLKEKYSFNREINSNRINRERLVLPIKSDETPDYEYMEQYIKNIMYKQLRAYLQL